MADKSLMEGISNDDRLEISMYPRGVPGYTYTPHVASDGTLTWTNNGGLDNPTAVNIMGPQGPQGLIEFQIVSSLPEVGNTKVLYLLDLSRDGVDSLYDEYIWVNNKYELVSEGKRTLNTNAQGLIGYYYNTTPITELNIENYLDGGEYALIVNTETANRPSAITAETNIVLKTYQSADKEALYQELINFLDNKKYVRTITKIDNSYNFGEWTLGTSGGIEIGEETPTDSSTILWIDTNEESEIFDPNDYYTKNEVNAKIVNTLDGGEVVKAPSVAAVNNAFDTQLNGLKIVSLTQTAYDNLTTKDNSTIYFIVGA